MDVSDVTVTRTNVSICNSCFRLFTISTSNSSIIEILIPFECVLWKAFSDLLNTYMVVSLKAFNSQ